MNIEDERTILETQAYFNLPSGALVEKDFYVAQAIRIIASIDVAPFTLVFGGGTALARAHKLIQRMSEDIDFKIVPSDDMSLSRSALKRELGDLKGKIKEALIVEGFSVKEKSIQSRNEHHYINFQIPYNEVMTAKMLAEDGSFLMTEDGDHLILESAAASEGLRSTIQIELTYSDLKKPTVKLPISSFIAEAFHRPAEVAKIECVAIDETAAEKLIALTRRTAMQLAGQERKSDTTLVRHIYDLHVIRHHYDATEVAALAKIIMLQDAKEFGSQFPAYLDDPIAETKKALDAIGKDPHYARLYADFQRDMVYGQNMDFADSYETLRTLVEQVIS